MAVRYYCKLKDQAGADVALFDDWRRLNYRHRVNHPGSCVFAINGTDARRELFETDGQIEVWRSDKQNGIDWYLEWEGLVITALRNTGGDGDKTFTVYCVGYADLLARRIVAYKATTAGADKSGTASTTMIEYARENAGDLSTTANGRIIGGVTPGLGFGTDPAAGGTWAGARAYDNLLEVLQGIAQASGVDFDVVGVGAALFEFRTYAGQRGTDRTVTGLSTTTARNSAGYAPVVFASELGNMVTPSYSLARDGSVNRVYALGQGDAELRDVVVRANQPDQVVSPLNLREAARQATDEETTAGLRAVADEILFKLQPRESFNFGVLQTGGALYGIVAAGKGNPGVTYYTWGDRVTARYDTIERNKRLVGVEVALAEDGRETIAFDAIDYGAGNQFTPTTDTESLTS